MGATDVLTSIPELMQALKNILIAVPPSIGASVVKYEGDPARNHLRIINTSAATIHGFRLFVGEAKDKQSIEPRWLMRLDRDVFGSRVNYEIGIPDTGVYVRPHSHFYLPLTAISGANQWKDVWVSFQYTDENGEAHSSPMQPAVQVKASIIDEA